MHIILHYKDLRIHQNPALYYASEKTVLPIYIYNHKNNQSIDNWLQSSLSSLKKEYAEKNVFFYIFEGDFITVLKDLIKKTDAEGLFYNKCYEPEFLKIEKRIYSSFKDQIKIHSYEGNYLISPDTIKTKNDTPYKIFTPFYKSFLKEYENPKSLKINSLNGYKKKLSSFKEKKMQEFTFPKHFLPGENEALKKCKKFIKTEIDNYHQFKDFPYKCGTSLLSPHLHFGEINPHFIWREVNKKTTKGREFFLKELIWREFANNLLYHFQDLNKKSWKKEFRKFPWTKNKKLLQKWKTGQTGYPIVDAGIKQLISEGWMHNRVRMIVASFLTKDLLIPWQDGADWFLQKLFDADLASNSMNWQWVAGSGPDASPFFRIFNPISQSKKFDPEGNYIRKFLPELKNLDSKWIHEPSKAPHKILEKANITLGKTYPAPLADHNKMRKKALSLFKKIKK